MGTGLTPELVRAAVRGCDRTAIDVVVRALLPVVQARVARTLLRSWVARQGRDVRQEVEDLVQDVFEALLADRARLLLAWDPERGSAQTYFGMIAECRVRNALGSARWRMRTGDAEYADKAREPETDFERLIASRHALRALESRLREGLNERDRRLFELLYIDQRDDDAVQAELAIGRDALYQARRRLRTRIMRIAEELIDEKQP